MANKEIEKCPYCNGDGGEYVGNDPDYIEFYPCETCNGAGMLLTDEQREALRKYSQALDEMCGKLNSMNSSDWMATAQQVLGSWSTLDVCREVTTLGNKIHNFLSSEEVCKDGE